MKNVILFADTRTGSSCIFFLLRKAYDNWIATQTGAKQHGGIGEPFHPGVINYFCTEEVYKHIYDGKKYKPLPMINEDWNTIERVFDKTYEIAYGIKHIWSHLDPYINYCILLRSIVLNHKIVFLTRGGVVKKSLSHMLAQQTDQWGWYDKQPTFTAIDMKRLRWLSDRYIKTKNEYGQFVSQYNDTHYVEYEELFDLSTYEERLERFQQIMDYIGIDRQFTPHEQCQNRLIPDKKQNKDNLLKTVPNIKKIIRYAKNTFDEDIISD